MDLPRLAFAARGLGDDGDRQRRHRRSGITCPRSLSRYAAQSSISLCPLEQVRAGIGSFDLILDHVRQRRLDDLARVIRLIGLRRLLSPLVAGVVVVGAVYLALAAGRLWDVGGLLVGLGVVLVLAVGGWRRMRYPRREGGSRADLSDAHTLNQGLTAILVKSLPGGGLVT